MDTRIDFLTRSIEEAHRTIRFTDMKAAGLVIFESLLLVVAIAGFAGNPMRGLVRNLIEEGVIWYAALILATFILYAMALVVHILLTIRVLLPVDKPELHVNLGDFDPVGLFYLGRLDEERRITPSVSAYGETLGEMGEEEMAGEYIFELQKLAFIRRIKGDRLALSVLLLAGLIIGGTMVGFLLAIAGFLF
jgi:hypothetical protein